MNGIQIITNERLRQQEEEGWTPEHDAQHISGELGMVAACYANPYTDTYMSKGVMIPTIWPNTWDYSWWKPLPDDRIKELAKAGALIAAEIDRLLAKNKKLVSIEFPSPLLPNEDIKGMMNGRK